MRTNHVAGYERIQMECPWCMYQWTHIFIRKTPPQAMKCTKCGQFIEITRKAA